mmetsp:Transcript_7228/g.8287  ORF Transcript_7228/g.8287 Transcript_7228/m.8287 type:complete len:267 (-) Transcript_7228:161-961(-)
MLMSNESRVATPPTINGIRHEESVHAETTEGSATSALRDISLFVKYPTPRIIKLPPRNEASKAKTRSITLHDIMTPMIILTANIPIVTPCEMGIPDWSTSPVKLMPKATPNRTFAKVPMHAHIKPNTTPDAKKVETQISLSISASIFSSNIAESKKPIRAPAINAVKGLPLSSAPKKAKTKPSTIPDTANIISTGAPNCEKNSSNWSETKGSVLFLINWAEAALMVANTTRNQVYIFKRFILLLTALACASEQNYGLYLECAECST